MISESLLSLLERLCNAVAVSGDEGEVRQIVLEEVKTCADEVRVDALGNVLAVRRARTSDALRVMLAAHMDEVGFMLVAEEGEGLYRFETVGSVDVRYLVGKPVWVGKDHLPGVIGARPIHLTTPDERSRKLPLDALRIDLGPSGKVEPGTRATFATPFRRLGNVVLAKALDNRLGVATVIELLRNAPDQIEVQAAFTVQEEIGLRGARVAAYALQPHIGIAVDSTPAHDLPTLDGRENTVYNTRLGHGPAIYVADGATFSDPRLVRFLEGVAQKHSIPYQIRQPGGGGTDAGAIQRVREGIPVVSVSVPGRYPHTPAALTRLEDWENTLRLLSQALKELTPAVLS
ncbi:MAG: M20/M25/M40 family metallo-hydrolase [Anaerolineales bacterium]